jgi:TRAP-type C4-dicarboxylate transport system substrate-binding protein
MRHTSLKISVGVFFFIFLLICFTSKGADTKPNVINLKMANIWPPVAPHSKICDDFIAELDRRTGGRIKIRLFAGSSLLKPDAMYQGIESGIADIGVSNVEYTPGRFPITEVCNLPLGYPNAWVANQVVNDFHNEFKPSEFDKIEVLWMHSCGTCLIISKTPVHKLEDLKGLTLRAPGRLGDTMKALGANPVPAPIMEVYDSIAKGVMDGINAPFETLRSFRFAEVAKYTTANWQVGNISTFYTVMNKNSYNKLPPDLKVIFDRVSGEFKERFALMWNYIDVAGKEFAQKNGVKIISLSSEEADRWKKATAPVVENYVKEMVSKGYSETEVRGWIKFLRERIDYWTAKQLKEVGLPSATGAEVMQ